MDAFDISKHQRVGNMFCGEANYDVWWDAHRIHFVGQEKLSTNIFVKVSFLDCFVLTPDYIYVYVHINMQENQRHIS